MKSPAFSWYVRDWLCSPTVRDLHRRRDRSVAAYFFLLNEAWLQEPQATLPDDPDALADLARVTREEFDSFWPTLKSQFESDGNGRIFNPRQFHVWRLQQTRQQCGRRGGEQTAKRTVKQKQKQTVQQTGEQPLKTKTKTKTKYQTQER